MEIVSEGIKNIAKKLVIYVLAVGFQLFIGRMAAKQMNFLISMAIVFGGWMISAIAGQMLRPWLFARGGRWSIINYVIMYLLYVNLGVVLFLYFLINGF